jgi:hypothetical protein
MTKMDLAQLEVVMNTILKLGSAGESVMYVWLFLEKGLSFIIFMVFFFLLYKVCVLFSTYLSAEQKLQQLRDILGIGCSGILGTSERIRLYAKLEDLCRKSAEEERNR